MVREKVYLRIYGESFNPKKIIEETGNIFCEYNSVGDIGKRGRFKNKPLPYGSATIEPPNKIEEYKKIMWLIEFTKKNLAIIQKYGGDDITFKVVYYYKNQCNCELSVKAMKGLIELNLPFVFSVYEDGFYPD